MKRSERTFIKHLFGAKVVNFVKSFDKQDFNRQGFSAGNHSLRLPALRPCLLKHSKIVVLSTILGVFCGPVFVNLLLPEANVSAASLTLSIPDSISVSINTQNSVAYKESNKSNITIKTDAYAGYTLNIKSSDGTNTLKSSDGKTINSIESPLDDYQASGATNTWAFLPGKLNSVENNTYQPGPKTDILVGKSSNSNSEPEVYPISIAAKIDGNQPTGIYKNSFIITATANPIPYEITYDYNNGSGSITPNPQTGTGVEGETIKLSDETPTRANYEFLGWCDVPTDNEECNGNKYGKGANYTLKNNDNKFTFYSIWKSLATGNMQNWNGCSGLTQDNGNNGNSIYTILTDIRDNNNYKVAKLKDGKCWMIENLRIAGKVINSTDSDMLSGEFSIPNEAANFTGTNNNAAFYNPSYSSGYYSWYTTTTGSTISSGNASNSICPKKWHLPTSSNNSDFEKLAKAYGNGNDIATSEALRKLPVPGFTLIGSYNGKTIRGQDEYSIFWSSTICFNNLPCGLYINTTNVIYSNYNDPFNGFSVRCVFGG